MSNPLPEWTLDNSKVQPMGTEIHPAFVGVGVLGGRRIIEKDGKYILGELAPTDSTANAHDQHIGIHPPFTAVSGGGHPGTNSNAAYTVSSGQGSTPGRQTVNFFENATNVVARGGHFAYYSGNVRGLSNRGRVGHHASIGCVRGQNERDMARHQASIALSSVARQLNSLSDSARLSPSPMTDEDEDDHSEISDEHDRDLPSETHGHDSSPFGAGGPNFTINSEGSSTAGNHNSGGTSENNRVHWENNHNGTDRSFGTGLRNFTINGGDFVSQRGRSYVRNADITFHR